MMRSKLFWPTVGALLMLLVLLGIMGHYKPEGGPVTLHVPENPEQVAPFLASSLAVVDVMLRLAEVQPEETVYDLGCGDARILVLGAEKHGARGHGVELDAEVFALARALLHDSPAARVGALFQLLVQDTTAQDFGLPSSAIRLRM